MLARRANQPLLRGTRGVLKSEMPISTRREVVWRSNREGGGAARFEKRHRNGAEESHVPEKQRSAISAIQSRSQPRLPLRLSNQVSPRTSPRRSGSCDWAVGIKSAAPRVLGRAKKRRARGYAPRARRHTSAVGGGPDRAGHTRIGHPDRFVRGRCPTEPPPASGAESAPRTTDRLSYLICRAGGGFNVTRGRSGKDRQYEVGVTRRRAIIGARGDGQSGYRGRVGSNSKLNCRIDHVVAQASRLCLHRRDGGTTK